MKIILEMDIKYVHLAIDEKFLAPFFIPNLIDYGNIREHIFLIVSNEVPQYPISHTIVNHKYINGNQIQKELNNYGRSYNLIIHGFTDIMKKPILKLPNTILITAIVYGFEFYKMIFPNNLYQNLTKALLNEISIKEEKKRINYIQYLKSLKWRWIEKKSLKRINFIAHYLPSEYNYFKSILNFKAPLLDFNLGKISQILNLDDLNQFEQAKHILIGNSGNATNNHLEILDCIKNFELRVGQKIYCPLSYSNTSDEYQNEIIRSGEKKFKSSFIPIVNFISSKEYNQILASCSHIFLNHHRSQGGASVWSALYRGSSLYLSNKNPLYTFFRELGAHIFTLDEYNGMQRLNETQKTENRNILLSHFSNNNVKKRYENLLYHNCFQSY
ncbi:MAG: TDP-N-acetylfucosamine:lipid II N-acetylfucosaminyltransferase [Reichenbachiella sp.]